MARYEITYACGHSDKVNVIGSPSAREWRISQLQKQLCFDCYKEQRLQAAQTASKERDLIALVGKSDAQVNWAMSIRLTILEKMEQEETRRTQPARSPEEEQLRLFAIDALYKVKEASQWIDWRDLPIDLILAYLLKQLLAAPTQAQVAQQQHKQREHAQAEAKALAEATLRPEQPVTETLAEITYTTTVVRVRFPENREDFNSQVRRLGYTWIRSHRRWERELQIERTGPARERAIEIGHVLLTHGFCVCVFDDDLRSAIIEGRYTPEQTRWIGVLSQSAYTGWFALQWGRDEDYYTVARLISQSRYYSPFVVVPPQSFDKLLDFAQRYDFRLTPSAQIAAEQAREQREATLIVKKEKPRPRAKKVVARASPPVLEVPELVEVDEEFSDADHH